MFLRLLGGILWVVYSKDSEDSILMGVRYRANDVSCFEILICIVNINCPRHKIIRMLMYCRLGDSGGSEVGDEGSGMWRCRVLCRKLVRCCTGSTVGKE